MTVTVSVVACSANAPDRDPRIDTLCLDEEDAAAEPARGPELSNAADLPERTARPPKSGHESTF
ncbi:hypothetical protein [Streptomyces sp. NPDC001568]|uniref:hypothetical protein n=1 Tax=Streptomyces sp. NPDC001568 TaxID=3364588 RepID=UPI00368CE687